ncbi:DUF4167 domain-containing protein [Limibacillus sp. MBR-115]|uniref:DUF4167 domain-containing protein n=1 Tax=Limibacillus sp. MBR-115 TaxID=3156465 RepID=UPI00339AB650
MRPGSNARRPRGRPHRRQGGGGVPNKNQNFDSNGPDGRVRGNAHQVYEKYIGLARDAQTAGDRILSESHLQHAEHYFRIVNDSMDPHDENRRRINGHDGQDGHQGRHGGNDGSHDADQQSDQPHAADSNESGGLSDQQEHASDGNRQDDHAPRRRGRRPGSRDTRPESRDRDTQASPLPVTDVVPATAPSEASASAAEGDGPQPQAEPQPKRRGRPRKVRSDESVETSGSSTTEPVES